MASVLSSSFPTNPPPTGSLTAEWRRLHFLYQLSHWAVLRSPALSSHFGTLLRGVSCHSSIPLHSAMEDRLCKKCSVVNVPSWTTRIERKKDEMGEEKKKNQENIENMSNDDKKKNSNTSRMKKASKNAVAGGRLVSVCRLCGALDESTIELGVDEKKSSQLLVNKNVELSEKERIAIERERRKRSLLTMEARSSSTAPLKATPSVSAAQSIDGGNSMFFAFQCDDINTPSLTHTPNNDKKRSLDSSSTNEGESSAKKRRNRKHISLADQVKALKQTTQTSITAPPSTLSSATINKSTSNSSSHSSNTTSSSTTTSHLPSSSSSSFVHRVGGKFVHANVFGAAPKAAPPKSLNLYDVFKSFQKPS